MIHPTTYPQAWHTASILRCGCAPPFTGSPIMWLGDDGVTEYRGVVLSRRWTRTANLPEYINVMPSGTQRSVRVYRDKYHAFLSADGLKRYMNPVLH